MEYNPQLGQLFTLNWPLTDQCPLPGLAHVEMGLQGVSVVDVVQGLSAAAKEAAAAAVVVHG